MTPLAVLPMYDRPEVRTATDRLWAALRDALRAEAIPAPDTLDRDMDPMAAWTSPALVLGQTCGLPYAHHLAGRVTLLGAPDFGLEGCPPGHYCSVLVVRSDEARETLAAFAGVRPAVNDTGSQSGYAALMAAAARHARDGRFFGPALMTGGHGASAEAVAAGNADIAALDAVSWMLMLRHDGVARRLRELGRTAPTPGLPYITAADTERMADAVAEGIAALDGDAREALGLQGFVRFAPGDYLPLAERLTGAERRHRLPSVP